LFVACNDVYFNFLHAIVSQVIIREFDRLSIGKSRPLES